MVTKWATTTRTLSSQVCDFCCLLVDNLRYFKFHWVKLKVDSFTVDRGVLECFRVWDVCLEETIPG